jgi:hypothetical protein
MSKIALTDIKHGQQKEEDSDVKHIAAGEEVEGLDDDTLEELEAAGAIADDDTPEAMAVKQEVEAPPTSPTAVEAEKQTVLKQVGAVFGQEIADAIRKVEEDRAEEAREQAESDAAEAAPPEDEDQTG